LLLTQHLHNFGGGGCPAGKHNPDTPEIREIITFRCIRETERRQALLVAAHRRIGGTEEDETH
jgi:hypothetical protein